MTAEEVKESDKVSKGNNETGLEPNVAALLAYLLDIVGGLIFFLIEKDDKFVRFAGAQSMALGIANLAMVWMIIPIFSGLTLGFGVIIYPVYILAYIALRVVLMVKAYQKQEWELPIIGKIARSFIK